jgi:hypothetical protein
MMRKRHLLRGGLVPCLRGYREHYHQSLGTMVTRQLVTYTKFRIVYECLNTAPPLSDVSLL